jgi:hypothetical protein
MAEGRGGGGARDRAEAAFIARIVKDPKNPPKTTLLMGYLGRSSEEGHTRVYLDPELSEYVEVPNEAILHTEAAGEEDPLAGSYIWISRSAEVVHGEAGGQRYKASFLEGRITQDYMGQAAGLGGLGPAGPIPPTLPVQCNPSAFSPYCPTQTFPCPPSQYVPACPPSQTPILCPPTVFGCPPTIIGCPPSVPIFRCPTRFPPLCPPPSVPIFRCPTRFLPLCPTKFPPLCPPRSVPIWHCPSQIVICQSVAIRCQFETAFCPAPTSPAVCVQPSVAVQCPTFGACPSAVDACPSAPGQCTIDPTFTTVINPGGFAGGGLAAGYTGGYGMG